MDITKEWSNSFLQLMSLRTDPLAENIIATIVADNDFKALHDLFAKLNNNSSNTLANDLPKVVTDYFNAENELPSWANTEKIALAQQVFTRYGPQISLLLNFKSLPLCYACKNGAKVLAMSGRLTERGDNTKVLMRRLLETAQMVMNVMSIGGLAPNGKGLVTVKKVRLYHAAIRYFVSNPQYNPTGWDTEEYGAPINQEEMAGTLMAFSALIISGLHQIGVELTTQEKDAYLHCWNIVGHFIGLTPELYPNNYNDGYNLGIAIIKRNALESNDGKLLTKSLIDFSTLFFNNKLLNPIPTYLVSYFISDVEQQINVNLHTTLCVKQTQSWYAKIIGTLFLKILKLAASIESHNFIVRKLVTLVSIRHMQGMIANYLHNNNVAFYIPASLKESWNMK